MPSDPPGGSYSFSLLWGVLWWKSFRSTYPVESSHFIMRELASRGNEWLVRSGSQFPYSAQSVSHSRLESIVPGTVMQWKKQSGILKYFSQNAGIKRADVERKTSNTWDKHSHQYPVKAKLSSRLPVSFLYNPLEQRDNSNCLFTNLIQVGNKQQSRHARISWTREIFFGSPIISFFNLIFYIFSFHYKAFKRKCSSTDKQVVKFSRKNKYLLLMMIKKHWRGQILTRCHYLKQNILLAKTSQKLYKVGNWEILRAVEIFKKQIACNSQFFLCKYFNF